MLGLALALCGKIDLLAMCARCPQHYVESQSLQHNTLGGALPGDAFVSAMLSFIKHSRLQGSTIVHLTSAVLS